MLIDIFLASLLTCIQHGGSCTQCGHMATTGQNALLLEPITYVDVQAKIILPGISLSLKPVAEPRHGLPVLIGQLQSCPLGCVFSGFFLYCNFIDAIIESKMFSPRITRLVCTYLCVVSFRFLPMSAQPHSYCIFCMAIFLELVHI